MTLDPLILDLGPWAIPLGTLFSQALSPATPAMLHRSLAEQACTMLEQAAATATEAPDEEAPWRAMQTPDALFLALEDGFAFAQFEGPSLASLRVETDDGRRWSVIRTGQGLLSFGLPDEGGPDPDLKIALFEDERLLWSRSFYPDGREVDDRDFQGALGEARDSMAQAPEAGEGPGFGLGAAGAAALGAAVLGAGAILARKALERKAEKAAAPPPPAPVRPPWRVVGVTGPLRDQSFVITGTTLLGREKSMDLSVEDASVSRRHAELKVLGEGLRLTDLGSSNGTWLGDSQLLAPVLLKHGDTFALGTCRFRVEGPPDETATVALPNEKPAPAPPLPPPLPVQALCPSCRKPLEPDWRFCGHCGAPIRP